MICANVVFLYNMKMNNVNRFVNLTFIIASLSFKKKSNMYHYVKIHYDLGHIINKACLNSCTKIIGVTGNLTYTTSPLQDNYL